MQPARAAARQVEARLRSPARALLAHPVKRAFAGLGICLAVGFVPAAGYALGVSGGEVRAIRARQTVLSARVRTDELSAEYDRLDAAVGVIRGRGMRNTALVWLLTTSVAGAAWARLAPRG